MPDRLFMYAPNPFSRDRFNVVCALSDMKRAYTSAAQDIRGDVRELIPEFFSCPEYVLMRFLLKYIG